VSSKKQSLPIGETAFLPMDLPLSFSLEALSFSGIIHGGKRELIIRSLLIHDQWFLKVQLWNLYLTKVKLSWYGSGLTQF
jgi:hypothetical protein